MKKTIALMARSWRDGGRCVAGIDPETKRWIRFVASADPAHAELPRGLFEAFYDLDLVEAEAIRAVPCACQTENFLLDLNVRPERRGRLTFCDLMSTDFLSTEERILGNSRAYLTQEENAARRGSLGFYKVDDLNLEYFSDEDGSMIYRSSFRCAGEEYSGVAVTDLVYRREDFAGQTVQHALVVIGLPALPDDGGRYYKCIEKIFPISQGEAERAEDLIRAKRATEAPISDETDGGEGFLLGEELPPEPVGFLDEDGGSFYAEEGFEDAPAEAEVPSGDKAKAVPSDPAMDAARAVRFLRSLAEGKDPDSGAPLDPQLVLTRKYAEYFNYCANLIAESPIIASF